MLHPAAVRHEIGSELFASSCRQINRHSTHNTVKADGNTTFLASTRLFIYCTMWTKKNFDLMMPPSEKVKNHKCLHQISCQFIMLSLGHFIRYYKCQAGGGTRGKVRGSGKSLPLILPGDYMVNVYTRFHANQSNNWWGFWTKAVDWLTE